MSDTKARDSAVVMGLMMLVPVLMVKPYFMAFNIMCGNSNERTQKTPMAERQHTN